MVGINVCRFRTYDEIVFVSLLIFVIVIVSRRRKYANFRRHCRYVDEIV